MLKKSATKNLRKIVGENNSLFEIEMLDSFAVDGIFPGAVVFPESVEQVSEIMKAASKERLSVIPYGSGTKSSLGNKPERADIILSTQKLERIIEHADTDLVATTECGITIKKFQSELNNKNQFLALDPPHVNRYATVGGVLATNDSGPQRLRYGTAREFLIGVTIVKADGSVFKGGSKVVKNVAGYDLPKLYVGSLGTLGIIVEATFRLYPVPEFSETYVTKFPSLELCHKTVLELLNSDLVINSLEILNSQLVKEMFIGNDLDGDDGYTLLVCIRNVEKAVKDQITKVKEICSHYDSEGFILNYKEEVKLWNEVLDFSQKLAAANRVVCKSSVLVSQIPILLNQIETLSKNYNIEIQVATRAGNGISIIAFQGTPDIVTKILQDLRTHISSINGGLIIQEAPLQIKDCFDVWGNMGSGLEIMKRIKSAFDPDNILNPGRYV